MHQAAGKGSDGQSYTAKIGRLRGFETEARLASVSAAKSGRRSNHAPSSQGPQHHLNLNKIKGKRGKKAKRSSSDPPQRSPSDPPSDLPAIPSAIAQEPSIFHP